MKGKGKHHIGDFLPADELKKFTAKVKAVKGESSLDNYDFSDYAEHKIKEDNIGYKMLQQAGWKEGMGLGSQGQGITAPVNKYVDNSWLYPDHPTNGTFLLRTQFWFTRERLCMNQVRSLLSLCGMLLGYCF